MSKKNRGKKRKTTKTYRSRCEKMLERMQSWQVRNQLIPRKRKHK